MEEVKLGDVQQIAMEIMKNIDFICRKLDLKYSLFYGSLIGAIRHSGFIPWDDDIDIMMPVKDYNKFLDYFKNNKEKVYPYEIFSPEDNNDYPYMISRVSDSRYVIDTENEKDYSLGIFVDIYPFYGLGNDREYVLKNAKKGDYISSLCFRSTRLQPIKKGKGFAIDFFEILLHKYAKFKGLMYFKQKLWSLASQYKYEDCKYVGCITWLSGGEKDIFLKADLEELIEHKFGKYNFYIPKNYDKVLRITYGDYMKLPSIEEQRPHHLYKVYKK